MTVVIETATTTKIATLGPGNVDLAFYVTEGDDNVGRVTGLHLELDGVTFEHIPTVVEFSKVAPEGWSPSDFELRDHPVARAIDSLYAGLDTITR